VPDLAELRSFAREVFGDLLTPGGDRKADLLGSLAAYFRSGGSLQRTAAELHVHPNTVAYRIRRVEELAGLHLERYEDRLAAQVALEIISSIGGW
jgi:DNA-binding PucR family transcriptional regulator